MDDLMPRYREALDNPLIIGRCDSRVDTHNRQKHHRCANERGHTDRHYCACGVYWNA